MDRKIYWLVLLTFTSSILASACVPTPTPPASGKPSILLAAPPHGSQFGEGDTVVIQSASGDAAGIARVDLVIDGALVHSDSAPSPQTYFNIVQNWQATPGTHTLSVRAYNTAGIPSDAASVSITVLPTATAMSVAATTTALPIATVVQNPSGASGSAAKTCTDGSELVIEAVPEGTLLAPGQPFDKGWRMKNSGTCAWEQGYAFVFVSGEAMANDTTIPFSDVIPPGETADTWIVMSAPTTSGIHQGQWQMRNARGNLFGAIFKASINVIVGVPAPAAVAPTATPAIQSLPSFQALPSPTPWWMAPLRASPTSNPFMGALPSATPIVLRELPTRPPNPFMGALPSATPIILRELPTRPPNPFMGVLPSPTPKR